MSVKRMIKEVAADYHAAERKASLVVRAMATKILREHPNLDYFDMSMGCWNFVDKQGNDVDDRAYMQPLIDFINVWDDYLKITGEPMHLTAKEPTHERE